MAASVITIARTIGSQGEDVGQIVARQLGFRYADDEIINEAASRAGVSREAVERVEHRQSLITRILETMGSVPLEPQVYYGQALAAVPLAASASYDELIRDVIVETANAGNVVIVAHGAGMRLAGTHGLLRVFVTAPDKMRAERIAKFGSVDAKRAEKAVADSDKDREDFLKRFYDVAHEQATHYDLVLNTENLSPDKAAELVVAAAKA
jgi:cytidylate kinase-like protein